jgi:hypothetical protein
LDVPEPLHHHRVDLVRSGLLDELVSIRLQQRLVSGELEQQDTAFPGGGGIDRCPERTVDMGGDAGGGTACGRQGPFEPRGAVGNRRRQVQAALRNGKESQPGALDDTEGAPV